MLVTKTSWDILGHDCLLDLACETTCLYRTTRGSLFTRAARLQWAMIAVASDLAVSVSQSELPYYVVISVRMKNWYRSMTADCTATLITRCKLVQSWIQVMKPLHYEGNNQWLLTNVNWSKPISACCNGATVLCVELTQRKETRSKMIFLYISGIWICALTAANAIASISLVGQKSHIAVLWTGVYCWRRLLTSR